MYRTAVVIATLAVALSAATVTIDETQTYQTIEGMGAFGAARAWWKNPVAYHDQAFVDLVVEDLGLSMSRNEYYPLDASTCPLSDQIPYLQALKSTADALGQEMRFIATYWTPPASYKDNNSRVDGGHVLRSRYDDLAGYCVQTVNRYRDEAGIDLYALSFANEPRFVEPYNSCVWTEEEYRDFVKTVGPRFDQEGIATKLFGPEDMLHSFIPYCGYINTDPEAKPHLDVVAVHGYADGVTPSGTDLQRWARARDVAEKMGIPLWMTETSGFHDTWESCMTQARIMLWAFSVGHISAWTWWQLGHYEDNNDNTLVLNGSPTWVYYAHKHFTRYIRPEARMVDAISDTPELLSVAFHHEQQRTLTIVLINQGTATTTVDLTGGNLPATFSVYRSTPSQRCASAGTVSHSIDLPGPSIVTLVAEGYDSRTAGAGTGAVPTRFRPPAGAPEMDAPLVTIDGRAVPVSLARHRLAPGVYCARTPHGPQRVVQASVDCR